MAWDIKQMGKQMESIAASLKELVELMRKSVSAQGISKDTPF